MERDHMPQLAQLESKIQVDIVYQCVSFVSQLFLMFEVVQGSKMAQPKFGPWRSSFWDHGCPWWQMAAVHRVAFTMFYHTAGLGPCGIFGQRCAQVWRHINPMEFLDTPKREWKNQNDFDFFSAHIVMDWIQWFDSIGLGLFLAPSLECRGGHWNILEPVEIKLIQAVFHLVVEAMWRAWLELEGVGVRQSWTEASLSWFRSFIGRRARKGENFHKQCHIRSCFIGNCRKLHCLLVC